MSASAGPAELQASALGRRRAQLVHGGVPGAGPDRHLSPADVENLRSNRSPEARAAFAARFGRQYDCLLTEQTKSLADAILDLLVRDPEPKVRQALAAALATNPNLPTTIASRLAHDEIEVARPILERSPVLSDDELSEIVRTHAMRYALAAAGRERLSEQLSELLAAGGEPAVVGRLVGNAGARLSAETLRRIAVDHRDDRRVQEALIRRPALPCDLVDQAITAIGERLEWELVCRRRMSAGEAQRLMAATQALKILARGDGERALEDEMRERMAAGELDAEAVLRALRDGDLGRVEAALAALAAIEDPAAVRELLYGKGKPGLAALCIKAGFATPHYIILRMALDLAGQWVKGVGGEPSYPAARVRSLRDEYERMRAAVAGRQFSD
jgi:uncharacterized protein (DUF2336 family)